MTGTDANAQALADDRAYGPNRALVLRVIRALTVEHEDDPEWLGASVADIAARSGLSRRWSRIMARQLADRGAVQTDMQRQGPWRPAEVYRARS